MGRREVFAGIAIGCICLGMIATAHPQRLGPGALTAAAFNGVWAPERRGPPGGPGGPRGPQGGPDGGGISLGGGGDLRGPGGGGFGPPPGAGFGPPPGARGPGGPGGPQALSAEDRAKGLEQGDIRTRSLMTPAGKAKFATFDPLDHPTSNCQTPGLPSIAQIPELQEWKIGATEASIRHESFATPRIVHLDQRTHPAGAHTVLGHAFGSLDGVRLTIETANLSAGWGGLGRNAPGSDQRVVRETYRLVDNDTIEGVIEITDPLYLTQVLRMPVTLKRQPAGTEIVDFPCDIEVSKRDYQYIKDGLRPGNRAE